ncbi:MAG: class I ribonucleotide reductase maintenance protein YfaE [Buchnera aphidicola (Chaetogeoica yunlongensis)]
MCFSKIKILNKNNVIYYKKTNIALITIFEIHNIFINSECRQGYCGTCRIQLLKGKIIYNKNLPLASYKPGEIFPCCCIANGNILVNF